MVWLRRVRRYRYGFHPDAQDDHRLDSANSTRSVRRCSSIAQPMTRHGLAGGQSRKVNACRSFARVSSSASASIKAHAVLRVAGPMLWGSDDNQMGTQLRRGDLDTLCEVIDQRISVGDQPGCVDGVWCRRVEVG